MSWKPALNFQLYDKSDGLVRIDQERIGSCEFSTLLPGGFGACSFRYPCDLVEGWRWYEDRHLYRFKVAEGNAIQWEGRVQDIALAYDRGSFLGVELSAIGYYANLWDRQYNQNFVPQTTTTLLPSSGGTYSEYTTQLPNNGYHFDKVDDPADDGDTTYIETLVNGHRSFFNLPDGQIPSDATITGVTVYASVRKTTVNATTMQLGVRTVSTDYYSANKTLTTSYVNYSNAWATNPNTGAAWTMAQIDALQIGVKSTSAQNHRVTRVWAVVSWYAGSNVATMTAGAIVKAVLTARCSQISSDQSNIGDPALDIGTQYFESDMFPGDIVERVVGYGDASDNQWFFAVWESKVAYLAQKATAVDWVARLANISSMRLSRSISDVWNEVLVRYSDTDQASTLTAAASDATSIANLGITRTRAYVIGRTPAAVAENYRDRFLAERKNVQQRSTIGGTRSIGGGAGGGGFSGRRPWAPAAGAVPGEPRIVERRQKTWLGKATQKRMEAQPASWVEDTNGVIVPLYRVRAGDVLRVADLIPDMTSSLDAKRTFYIRETRYNVDSNTLTLSPDYPQPSLADVAGGVLR